MKKIISFLLVVCMLACALPYVGSAVSYETYDTLLSAYATIGFSHSVTSKMTETVEKIGAYPYFHLTAAAGDYANSDLIFSFTPLNIVPDEYPIVKVNYRTNSPAAKADISMISPNGETWLKSHPSINADECWNSFIFDYRNMTGAGEECTPDPLERDISFRIKPFGSQSFTLTDDSYFDINYIAFFKTREEANEFEYNSFAEDQYKYSILTPEAIYSNYGGAFSVSSVNFYRIDADNSYVRYTAEPGTYGNNELVVSFTHDAFPLIERPYVKLVYRTDSTQAKLDLSMTSDKGENWPSSAKRPALVSGGVETAVVFSINDMTANSSVEAPDENSTVNVRLKPWGPGTKTLTSSSYFDLLYVGFFETEAEAEAYKYEGDSAYTFNFSQAKIYPDYSYASLDTVRSYIDEADERKNEIIHTNNTVPYIEHLSFSGLTGEYIKDTNAASDTSAYKLTAPAGSYSNGSGTINFTQKDVSFETFKALKISYKTEHEGFAYVTINSSVGAAIGGFTLEPSTYAYKTAVIPLDGITNGPKVLAGDNVSINIAPFGRGDFTLDSSASFSIEYIGVFRSTAGANTFDYAGENGANMTSTGVAYGAKLLDPANVPASKYFISSSTGNDSNDGLTPETAWKTIDKLNSVGSKVENSTVFLKRGDEWRITDALTAKGYTVYTSYGHGDKPALIASIDGTGSSKWSATSWDNIWLFNEELSGLANDVGHIRINGGELWGIKVSSRNGIDTRVENGDVFNGRTYIEPLSAEIEGGKGLYNDLEFYHDYTNGKLYLYCEDGNPGEVFSSIEIANKGHAVKGVSNVTIDNLYLTGAGSHGISFGSVTNGAVTNCHLEWIGGSIQTLSLSSTVTEGSNPVRFGNAIESYGSAINFTIANCFCSQIYDCCYTVQNQGAVTFDGVFMYDNVAEYSNTGLEVWQSGGITNNMYLHDNYTLFGGYGWSHQRPHKDGNFFYGGTGIRSTTFTNNSVENNVNVLAANTALLVSEIASVRYNFNHNVYIMGENKTYTKAPINTEGYGSPSTISYNFTSIQNVVSRGTDTGSTFYFVPTNIMNIGDDPYEIFDVSDNPVYDITTSDSSVTLRVGESTAMDIVVYPEDAENKDIYFSSSHPLVASVDESGNITAHYPGTVSISAISVESGVSVSMNVNVINSVDTPTLYSTDTPGLSETANVLFAGDALFSGENSVVSALCDNYYITPEVIASDSMTASMLADTIGSMSEEDKLIFVSAGFGDYLAGTSLDDFKNGLESIYAQIRDTVQLPYIVCVTPYNITSEANSAGLTLKDYADAAKEISDECLVPVADMYYSAPTEFALIDSNGNAGTLLTKYIDASCHTTELGASVFANDLIDLLVSELAFNIEGDLEYKYLYTASMLSERTGAASHMSTELVSDDTGTYVRAYPTSDRTSNDTSSFQFDLNDTRFNIKDYPIVKIYYRSSVAESSALLDLNIGVKADGVTTRLWMKSSIKPNYDKTGTVSSVTFDLANDVHGGDSIDYFSEADDDSPIVYLRFKPYYYEKSMVTSDYFDILSIAFFATAEEAEKDGVTEDITYMLGDLDSNGKVEAIDNVTLSRNLAEWKGYESVIPEASDINRDGYITALDSVTLSRYLASWRGYTDIFN